MSEIKWEWAKDGALVVNGKRFTLVGSEDEFDEWRSLLSLDNNVFNVFVRAMNAVNSGRGNYGAGDGYENGYERVRDIVREHLRAQVLYSQRLRDVNAFVQPPELSQIFESDGDTLEDIVQEIIDQRELKKLEAAKTEETKATTAAGNGKG